ncbi:DotI/IcmL/TraM family protein [Aeromonas sp. MrichA-1]|uniref:DotI/IcmL/TraM family protein n=1 Tax=Aeromonas sp. MrichA-1 TaxID=2823362 RepID=UPI001B320D8A|nr:DotI/IcmL/TraM family protein [Aeromonas sp. MrichA-1]MBP4081408.1 DotI/IcmL family type IV secretion protein [Aeromonas sp. MrichA-1]
MNNKNKKVPLAKAEASKPTRAASGAELIEERNNFYRDMYSKMWKISAIGVASMVLSIGMGVYVLNKKESNVYFATNEANTLIPLVALSEPNMKDSTVANWLTNALVDTFEFNYGNLKTRMNHAALSYFTKDGASDLISKMNDAGNFDVVVKKELLVNMTTLHTPLLINKGLKDGIFRWRFQIPAKITYRNQSYEYSNQVVFTVIVSRTSLLEHASGLGISSIVMSVVKED